MTDYLYRQSLINRGIGQDYMRDMVRDLSRERFERATQPVFTPLELRQIAAKIKAIEPLNLKPILPRREPTEEDISKGMKLMADYFLNLDKK